MKWMIAACILAVLCIFLAIRLYRTKGEIRSIRKQLIHTREQSYNANLTISLFDEDINDLSSEINRNLDYQKQLKRQTKQSELTLRQSVSDIAHDLRTPLTVIRGNLQMLGQDGNLDFQNRERLNICQSKAVELGEMVDDFFEMSVLESDSEPAELTSVNITEVLIRFMLDHETFIRDHDLTPDIHIPEKALFIKANERLLLRMLENLLSNVAKYAKDSFTLSLETTKDGQCRIVFSNSITARHDIPADASQLFVRTYRGSLARSGKGAGLGLYIVKLLAGKQGAEAYAAKSADRLDIGVVFDKQKTPYI